MTYRVLMKPSVSVSRKYVISTLIKLFDLSPFFLLLKVHGLGIRSAVDLCLPGFLSSCHGTSDLVASLLFSSGVTGDDPLLLEATNRWSSKLPLPPEDQRHV